MLEEGEAHGFALPVAARTLTTFDEASMAALGGRDRAHMPAYRAKKADRRIGRITGPS